MEKLSNLVENHWNKVYEKTSIQTLGWYEEIPDRSLQLISRCQLQEQDLILDVGSGSSTLIDSLIDMGYKNIIAADISEIALSESKKRLGQYTSSVKWIVDDVTNSTKLVTLSDVDLWHDRAVLHFLLDEDDQNAYKTLLDNVLKINGYVIIATFSLKGIKKCSGLDVKNYDHLMLSAFLGQNYQFMEYFEHTYIQPSGNPRPFVYTLFKKVK